MSPSYADLLRLESALNSRFRGHDTRDWDEWATVFTSDAEDVPLDAERAWLGRPRTWFHPASGT